MNQREEKGKNIAEKQDQIKRIDSNHYKVKSQSSNNEYDVISMESGFSCSCPDHQFKKVCCKHIHSVEISLQIRQKVEQQITTINPVNVECCPQCQSYKIKKIGIRHNKNYDIQMYRCKNCSKKFSMNLGFEKMRATPQIITQSLQLYFTGESLRNVQKFIKLQGVTVSHQTIYNWIEKYTNLMKKYLDYSLLLIQIINTNFSDKNISLVINCISKLKFYF